MADVAMVFHWSPEVMDRMAVEELAEWRERARVRVTPKTKTPRR